MLAGLLFAEHEALDRPGFLTATLPFGGATVIEYQARLLIAAGAVQLIVAVGRLTPELLGALGRIGKRNVAVDVVRAADETAGKLHPLSTVVMLADGLITTQELIDGFAGEGRDTLLVMPAEQAGPDYERLGGRVAWAGVARIDPRRIGEVAALPRDYDLQSSVLRLAEQAQATHVQLAPDAVRDGHGIEHSGDAFAARSRLVLAATVADRRDWFNAIVLGPAARVAAPRLLDRHVSSAAVGGGGLAVGVVGLAAMVLGPPWPGLMLVLIGVVTLGLTRVLASLRDEEVVARWAFMATLMLPALAGVTLGVVQAAYNSVAPVLAIVLLFLGAVGQRAIRRERRRRWWGGPPAYLLVATIGAVIGWPVVGLALAAGYAGATLAAAVEMVRGHA